MQVMELCNILEGVNAGEKASSIVRALRKDDLIWSYFIQSTGDLSQQIEKLVKEGKINPGYMGLLAFNPELLEGSYPDCRLQVSLLEECMVHFESFVQKQNPPASIIEAVKLSIVLIEKRRIASDWLSIWSEIIKRMQFSEGSALKNVWGSTIAVVVNLINDVDVMLVDLVKLQSGGMGIDLLIHAILCLPLEEQKMAEKVFKAIKGYSPEIIEKTLYHLISINERNLAEATAKLFVSQFSSKDESIEDLETLFDNLDLSVQKAMEYKQVASVAQIAGNPAMASGLMKKSISIMDAVSQGLNVQHLSLLQQSGDLNGYQETLRQTKTNPQTDPVLLQEYATVGHLPPQNDQQEAYAGLKLAKNLLQSGNIELARSECKRVLEGDHDSKIKQLTGFHSRFNPVWNPTDAVLDLLQIGAVDQAAKVADHLLKMNPSSEINNQVAAEAFVQAKKYGSALPLLEILALGEKKDADLLRMLSDCYEETGKPEASLKVRKVLTDLDRPESRDLISYAKTALSCGMIEDALQAASKVLEKEPHNRSAFAMIGKIHASNGNRDEAKDFFIKSIEFGCDDAGPWIGLAEIQAHEDDIQKSIETLHKGLTALPGNVDLKRELAKSLMESGSVAEALPYLNELTENDQDIQTNILKVEAMKALGMSEYKDLIEQLHEDNPENIELARELAAELIKDGRHDEAKQVIQERMNDIQPGDEAALTYVDAIVGLDVKFFGTGKTISKQEEEKAQTILEISLAKNSENIRAQLLQAEMFLHKGLNAEAFNLYSKLLEKQSIIDKSLIERIQAGFATAAASIGKFELALAAIKQAVDAKPDWIGLRKIFAQIYAFAGEVADAIDEAEKVIDAGSQIVESVLWFIDFVAGLGQTEEAEEKLKTVLQDMPGNLTLISKLAEIMVVNGKMDEAKEIMDSMKEELSKEISRNDLSICAKNFAKMDDDESALACLEFIVKKDFDVTSRLDHAGYLYQMGRYEDALSVVEKISADSKYNELVNAIKADILLKTGDLNQAKELLKKEFVESEEKPEIILTFGPDSWKTMIKSENPVLEMQARSSFTQGNASDCLMAATKWMEADSDNLEARLLVYESEMALGESPEEDVLPEIDEFSSDEFSAHVVALTIDRLLDADKAIEAQQLNEKFAQSKSISIKTAGIRIMLLAGHLPEAEEIFNEILSVKEKINSLESVRQLGLVRMLVKAGMALQRWNETLMISNEWANNFSWNLSCISQALAVLTKAKEMEELDGSLSIEAHGSVEYFKVTGAEEQFNLLAALAIDQSGRELEHWLMRGKMAITPVDENIRAFALITPSASDSAAMVAALHANDQDATALQVTKKFPESPEVLLELARIQMDQDDLESALETINKFISVDPINPIGTAFRSLIYENINRLDLAINDLEQAISDWPNEARWRTKAGLLWQKYGNNKNAILQLESAYDLKPDDTEVVLELGKACLEEKNPIRTIEVLLPLTQIHPNLYEAWETMANAYSMNGDMPKALNAAQKASEINPFSTKPHLMKGKIHLATGDLENAHAQAKAAVAQNKKDADAILFLARVLHEKGEERQALATLEATHHCDNITAQTMIDHVNLVREINGTASAKELIASLSSKYPENVELMKLLASAQEENGDMLDAEETARKALQVDPNEPEVHMFLGKISAESGQLDQAIHHLSQGIASRTANTDGYLLLSKVYEQQREFTKAIDTLKQAIDVEPEDTRSYIAAANLYKNSKNYSAAEEILQKAVEIDPEDVTLRRQLGALLALKLVHHSQEASAKS